jgi:hypothetical protein
MGSKQSARGRPHPQLAMLLKKLPPGRYAGGTIIITRPDAHRREMSRWLMGKVDGRVALGRTAFGDILVFRDLRARATAEGLEGAAEACDVAMIELSFKKMTVLAWSAEQFLEQLDRRKFQDAFLRRRLYDKVKASLGDFANDEVYAFVPMLPMGGSETADSVERSKWSVYQDLLFQV